MTYLAIQQMKIFAIQHYHQKRILNFNFRPSLLFTMQFPLLVASLSLLFPVASGFIGVSRIYKLDDLGPESLSWRIRGSDARKGNWKIRQMTFFKDYECKKKVDMSGASFSSSMGPVLAEDAFDNDPNTMWEHDDQINFFLGFNNNAEVSVKCIMLDYVPGWDDKDMPQFYIERLDLAGGFIDKYEVKGVSKGQNFINFSKICVDHTLFFWGDGQCSPALRNEECGWDGGDCGDEDPSTGSDPSSSPSSSNVGLIAGIVVACIAVALVCAALYFKKRRNEKQLPYISEAVPTNPIISMKREVTMLPMGDEPEFETSPRLSVVDDERVRIFADAARRKAEEEERARIEAERKNVQMKSLEVERVRIEALEAAKLKVLEDERVRIEAEEVARLQVLEEERIRIEVQEASKLFTVLEEERLRTETEEVAKLKALEEERLRVESEEKPAAITTESPVEVPTEPEEDLLSDKNQQVRL